VTAKSRGYAFVEFEYEDDARAAYRVISSLSSRKRNKRLLTSSVIRLLMDWTSTERAYWWTWSERGGWKDGCPAAWVRSQA